MKAFLPTALFINLSVATLMLVGLTSAANAAQKVQGFSVENCRPLNDKAIMIDFCSPQAIGLYKQQLSKPINFNRNYVLFPIDLPKSVKGWGKVTNYAALNPKTKQVIPMSFAFFADQGYARLDFSKNANKVCTMDHNTALMGDGENAGTYTPASDGNVNYCVAMIDNQFFSTTVDFMP